MKFTLSVRERESTAMSRKLMRVASAALALQIIGAAQLICPSDPNCVCGGTLAVELNCSIDGNIIKINLLPEIYINIKCENTTSLDYNKLPKCANSKSSFKSVSFKDCPLPKTSFKDVLTNVGVSKTMALIFQNARNLSGYFDRKHFAGLQDLTKLLLSINGVTHLPNNLFMDISKLTWLNIRSNSVNLSEELFKPLERLETLEISHNHMTNISSNLFSHLSFLRKLSLWQSNVTWFSKDLFSGVDVLEELDLSSNGLNELPAAIFKPLNKLKKLTLFSNKFSSLPENLFEHNYELETVVFLNNDAKLRDLPKKFFGNLLKLKQIYIQRSGIENVPCDVFANSSQITNISLAYNDIKTLPEPIFNDQINLLELDLSYNLLKKLDSKLFSSLVRLERLDLSYNSLEFISGPTFSSLLSLIYLNMEHNNLEIISSYLFVNNKQRMSISLAYNKLTFEQMLPANISCNLRSFQPFSFTYNLHLLNLSHNSFRYTSLDWWMNGHEKLDISGNCITNIWGDETHNYDYKHLIKIPLREVWISQNPMKCECRNHMFLDFLLSNPVTKIPDLNDMQCSKWSYHVCHVKSILLVALLTTMGVVYAVIIVWFLVNTDSINYTLKKKLFELTQPTGNKESPCNIVLKYVDIDEYIVLELILPELRNQLNVNIYPCPIRSPDNMDTFITNYTSLIDDISKNAITVIVFSPFYLMSTYRHIELKKIHTAMMEAEKTMYIFVDIGPENSVYAFLKDQRDARTSLLWLDPNLWDKFNELYNKFDCDTKLKKNYEAIEDETKESNISFSKIPDPNIYNLNALAHEQV